MSGRCTRLCSWSTFSASEGTAPGFSGEAPRHRCRTPCLSRVIARGTVLSSITAPLHDEHDKDHKDRLTVDQLVAEGDQLVDGGPEVTHVIREAPTFAELGVVDSIVAALTEVGISRAFPIQEMAIPAALPGADMIGQAKTGTGKTLAFGIPLLQRITLGGTAPQALVVVPTRELAIQVADDLIVTGRKLGSKTVCLYGGRSYEPQVETLRRGVDVVVGTPGRLLDLQRQRYLDLSQVKVLVLDEADRMLDMGFLPDVEKLVSCTPDSRQTMLFSATLSAQVVALARRWQHDPVHIRANSTDVDEHTVDAIAQYVYRVYHLDKPELLARLLQAEGRGPTIVFCRTKRQAQRVCDDMAERGFAAGAVHGDLAQGAREQAMRAFRNGKVDLLVATDVAARGLDIDGVTHVVNYSCPEDEHTYLHRIGRTGRAGADGVSVTFVDMEDSARWQMIDRALHLGAPTPEETFSTSWWYFEDLQIPETVTGMLPRASRTRAGLGAETVEDLNPDKPGSRSKKQRSGDSGARHTSSDRGNAGGGKAGAGGGRAGTAGAKPLARTRTPRAVVAVEAPVPADQASNAEAADESGSSSVTRRPRSRRRTRAGQDLTSDAGVGATTG